MSVYTNSNSDNCNTCTEDCTCNSCCENQECGCKMELDTKCSRYSGNTLPCLDIKQGDNLESIIQKLEDKYCNITDIATNEVGLALFQMWLDAGNTGTLEDFLATLVGTPGADGADGAPGAPGADGADGQDGSFGGFSNCWAWSSATTAPPSSTEMLINNIDYSLANQLIIHDVDFASIDMSAFVAALYNGGNYGTFKLFQESDPSKFLIGVVTNLTDNGTYTTIDYTYIVHNNSPFTPGECVVLTFSPAGVGTPGVPGAPGADGADGTGVAVLHNDLTVYSYTGAGFSSITNYTVPAATLATDGSKVKIDVLFTAEGATALNTFLKLQINGADAHTPIGNIDLSGGFSHGIFSYELNRKTNTTAVARYEVKMFTSSGGINNEYGFFENEITLGVLDFTASSFLIDVLGAANSGTSTVKVQGFSVELYTK